VHQKLASLSLPRLGRALDEGTSFKLTVHLLSASIPGLEGGGGSGIGSGLQGFLSRERPRIEVVLGSGARKETELGVLKPEDNPTASSADFPWHFGEGLTFTASLADILGPGLQIWLRTDSDLKLGSFQLNFARSADIGVASVDLRGQVLPAFIRKELGGSACEAALSAAARSTFCLWETPVMTLQLTCVSLNARPEMCALGEAAARVKLAFGISTDPQLLLEAADVATRPLLYKVAAPVYELVGRAEGGVKRFLSDADWARAEQSTRELIDNVNKRMPVNFFAGCHSAALTCDDCSMSNFGRSRSFVSSPSSSSSSSSPCSSPAGQRVAAVASPARILTLRV
jgi:hypothetical protein